ncbi:hypothetical protein GCM10022396_17700 [Flavivirga amylovorans]
MTQNISFKLLKNITYCCSISCKKTPTLLHPGLILIMYLSYITGNIHIAFKYTGSGHEIFDGVYELDDVSIDYIP